MDAARHYQEENKRPVHEKRYVDYEDIMTIYGVGSSVARKIIREIRFLYADGHPLPCGKVFISDLPAYEEKVRSRK